jgi:hypothetical protein
MKQLQFSFFSSLEIHECVTPALAALAAHALSVAPTRAASSPPSSPAFLGRAPNVAAFTLRTLIRPCGSKGDWPIVPAITALELALIAHFNFSTFDFKRLATHQGFGNLAMSRFDDSSESLPRNAHLLGGVLLIEPVEVRQSNGLEFIYGHRDNFQCPEGNSARLKEIAGGLAVDSSAAERSRHQRIAPSLQLL